MNIVRKNRCVVGLSVLALCLIPACPQGGGGQGGGEQPPPQEVCGSGMAILNVLTNIQVSSQSAQPLTVLYTAGSTVSGIYVRVESSAANAAQIGEPVVVAVNLPAGESQAFTVDLTELEGGYYRVGIVNSTECLSQGTIEIVESAQPQFVQPDSNLTVNQGDEVQVGLIMHDPTGALQWRLFYVDADGPFDAPADEIGTQIRIGQGNTDLIVWNTGNVDPGQYRLGLSSTASGLSIADTVEEGREDEIRTILHEFTVTVEEAEAPPTASSPLLEVTQPGFNVNAVLGASNTVNIAFEATIRVTNPVNPTIRVFYDQDGRPNTGDETTIAADLPPDTTSASLNTQNLAEGVYSIGVTVNDGVNSPVTVYARGRVNVTPDSLEVTAPDLALPVKPGAEVEIAWDTNVAPEDATVDVFRRALDANGQPTGPEIPILAPTNSGVTSATWTTSESGQFQISVRYKFTDTSKLDLVASAPRPVRVSGLPRVFWVGDLAQFSPTSTREQPEGALFEGHQFEDNAGSTFAAGDFNGDGLSDPIVAARYAKPEFVNPAGLGEGEAYLFRGSGTRYRGSINLNSVGSSSVPGLTFTGPPSLTGSEFTTQGLSSIFVARDADNDGIGEVVFGFPFTSSFRQRAGDIDADLQFENGGIIIVSSQNSLLRGELGSDTRGARMLLQLVGLNFEEREVRPEPGQGDLCLNASSWLADNLSPPTSSCPTVQECPEEGDSFGVCPDGRLSFPEGDTDCLVMGQPTQACLDVPVDSFTGCLSNLNPSISPDGQYDTLVEPKHGFAPHLAINFVNHYFSTFGAFPCTDRPHTNIPPFDGVSAPCPACHLENPNNDPGCVCEQWVLTANSATGFLEWHPATEPLCLSTTDYWPSQDPLALLPATDCDALAENTVLVMNANMGVRPLVDIYGIGVNPPAPSFIGSGYFRDRLEGAEDNTDVDWNEPLEPFGARIIGRPTDASHPAKGSFGTSIAQSGNELIVSAPQRDAVNGDDIDGLPSDVNGNSGVAYLFSNEDLWTLPLIDGETLSEAETRLDGSFRIPPKPHIYSAQGALGITGAGGFRGHTGFINVFGSLPPGSSLTRRDVVLRRVNVDSSGFDRIDQGGLTISGRANEHIENIIGVSDFNRDGRPDFAVGAPLANGGDGAVYVVYRRATSIEGNYVLDKLALAPNNFERLAGVYVVGKGESDAALGASLATDVDFDSNGIADVVMGSPNGNAGTGEVVIVFASNLLTSPANGISVDTLLNQRQAARITGLTAGSGFGFNVASAGDIDGDGTNDLLIAAPSAGPMFDSNPNDTTDTLTTKGLDRNLDGQKDDVTGPKGVPDGLVNDLDNLDKSGIVYVIFGNTDARKWASTGTGPYSISISKLGSAELPGFVIVGRRGDDLLAGGDATTANPNKTFGRSRGLAGVGDVDGDGLADIMMGSVLADPRVDPQTGQGTTNGGEAYLIYGVRQNE